MSEKESAIQLAYYNEVREKTKTFKNKEIREFLLDLWKDLKLNNHMCFDIIDFHLDFLNREK